MISNPSERDIQHFANGNLYCNNDPGKWAHILCGHHFRLFPRLLSQYFRRRFQVFPLTFGTTKCHCGKCASVGRALGMRGGYRDVKQEEYVDICLGGAMRFWRVFWSTDIS
jgi:hypothetical protein